MENKTWVIGPDDNFGEIQKNIKDGDRVILKDDTSSFEWTWIGELDAWQDLSELEARGSGIQPNAKMIDELDDIRGITQEQWDRVKPQLLDKDLDKPLIVGTGGEINKDHVEQTFTNLFFNSTKTVARTPSIELCVWDEEGISYSCWKIDTGVNIIYTNDAGKRTFEEALRKEMYL